jgi:H+/Cl- antiporter ClcA
VSSPRAAALARRAIPAGLVGVGSALTLILLSVVSSRLETVLWETLPERLGVGSGSAGWIVAVLTATGLVVGLVVWLVPGHAGPDPATQSLVSAPLSPGIIPGLALAVVIALAGGVSLGPENPIVAINVALAIWLGSRAAGDLAPPEWVGMAAAGTIGAMFGTPVGAALVLSETPADPHGPSMWDRLFAPLVAAACGSLVMDAFGQPVLSIHLRGYRGARWGDLVSAPVIALAAALAGVALVYAFPVVHAAFWRVRHPLVMLTLGGCVLGAVGAIGGKVTLFKGLDEMKQLATGAHTNGRLVVIIVVKLVAICVAASSGFRGGRIFPAVFVGVAIGLLAHQLVGSVPPALAVSAAILGLLLVVTRSGWLSLFMAATTVGDISVLPVLCIALLPAWLLVTDRPELLIEPEPHAPPAPGSQVDDASSTSS